MAVEPVHIAKARRCLELAAELETLADRFGQPSRSLVRADLLIAEGERIANEVRAVVRGRGLR